MGYLPPVTIAATLRRIQARDIVLPAIQREYVWGDKQVEALFDSLMRGYPIGSFLSWKVEPETAQQFKFYGFLKNYHERDNKHCPSVDLPPGPVKALLDGQQRLTSLNIGLRGSYASRVAHGRRNNPLAYPRRELFLNVHEVASENEDGLIHDFRILSQDQLRAMSETRRRSHFRVADIFEATEMRDVWGLAQERGWANDQDAADLLSKLWQAVHATTALHFYEEDAQDVERVLDIFIRVNSGGTVLSYSDLLLSIATAQWRDRDAREEIHGLVDAVNGTGNGFNFSQDVILKSGLVLAGVGDFAFKVKNFNAKNMALLSREWDRISESLKLAVGVLDDFGLSEATQPADSVLIPLAYYVHHRQLGPDYRTAARFAGDRELVRSWVLRSVVQPGVWGSGLDTLLREIRTAIDESGADRFPLAEIELRMAGRAKPLDLNDTVIDELLDLKYGQKRTFAFLAILFPHVNTRNIHHIDHIYPMALMANGVLRSAGFAKSDIDELRDLANRLPNLQLLEGPENIGKSDKPPAEWADQSFRSAEEVSAYLSRNELPTLPESALAFKEFYDARRLRLRHLVKKRLGEISPTTVEPSPGAHTTNEPPSVPLSQDPESANVRAESRITSTDEGAGTAAAARAVVGGQEEFVLAGSVPARASFDGEKLTVAAGSPARPWMSEGTAPSYEKLQSQLIEKGILRQAAGGRLEFARDVKFQSVSAAASVVAGTSLNGRKKWVHVKSRAPLSEWLS